MSTPAKQTGTVKCFNDKKAYGFITNVSGVDCLVHYSAIKIPGYKTLKSGQSVEYIQTETERGLQAAEVVPLVIEKPKWFRWREALHPAPDASGS